MIHENSIQKNILRAETRLKELRDTGSIKNLTDIEKIEIKMFYEKQCLKRFQTAKLLYAISKDTDMKRLNNIPIDYTDYAEIVATSYYSMYYIIHAYIAGMYNIKIADDTRGIHAITHQLVLYYLVKTGKLANYLYKEYIATLTEATRIQKIDIEEFQKKAYIYAEIYDDIREARETFTYRTTSEAEEENASKIIKTAETFINTIRQLMRKQ